MPDLTTATDEAKAKRRMEIEAKLSDLRLQQAKETEQKAAFFGEHAGITCDGCGVAIIGYRYKCKDCSNHDVRARLAPSALCSHEARHALRNKGVRELLRHAPLRTGEQQPREAGHQQQGGGPPLCAAQGQGLHAARQKGAERQRHITNLNPHHLTRHPPS
jgi:hypothetical protein